MKQTIPLTDWQTLTLNELLSKYQITLEEMYNIALNEELYKYETIHERRSWSDIEKKFIFENINKLSVREAGRIFHKSYNATLMYVKFIGAYEMIN